MASGVVTIGRQRYAVGLYWENSPGGGRVSQIAKEAARQPGQQADFYVVRPGNKNGRIPQFGLCSSEAGQRAGMPVLAGCLASQVPGSWAGAFRLSDGVVVTIVRDDLIVPDGDLFFRDEAEARDRLLQEIGFGGLQSIYAPESWSIPGADTIPLTLLLNAQQDIRLQRVSIPRKVKIAVTGLVLFFAVVLGGVWYQQEKIDEENALRAQQQQEALRRAQEAARQRLPSLFDQQKPPEPKYDRVWENSPKASAILEACQNGLAQIPAAITGWKLSTLTCSGSGLRLSWNREKGSSVPPPSTKVDDNAAAATQTIPLSGLAPRGPESLLDSQEITKRYLLQNWPGTIAKAPDDPPPRPPETYKGPWNPPPAPWVKRSFTLNVPELPSVLPGLIGDLPGAVVNNMRYSPSGISGSWVVEGVIYENRK